jgi:hypothetical protein
MNDGYNFINASGTKSDRDQTQPKMIAGRPIRSCSSCGAPIIWFVTKNLAHHPVDAASVNADDTTLDLQTKKHPQGKHVSHFATCPNADQHRKPR